MTSIRALPIVLLLVVTAARAEPITASDISEETPHRWQR
jgi:hypothetical protein